MKALGGCVTWTSACRHLSDGLKTFGRRFGKTRRAYMSTLADATQNSTTTLNCCPILCLPSQALLLVGWTVQTSVEEEAGCLKNNLC